MKVLKGAALFVALAFIMLGTGRLANSQVCSSRGNIVLFYALCDCTDMLVQTYGCQGLSGPKCDPYAGDIFCGYDGENECSVGYASDNCGDASRTRAQPGTSGTASHGIPLEPPPDFPASAKRHLCFENSALRIWLDARSSQKRGGRIALTGLESR
jgi:hypothetical protein